MKIGEYQVSAVVPTRFRLDGGAMFGSVPKALWSKKIVADEDNCIPLCCRVLVLESKSRRILVDLGSGQKWDEKHRRIYNFSYHPGGPLHKLVPDVSDIIITHLHFDHVGGVSYLNADGELLLSYPEATHHIQKENWALAHAPGPRERATYLSENITPLLNAKLNLLDGDSEILPGIEVVRSNGHTRGLQWVIVRAKDQTLVCPSELMPTAHHVSVPYVMGYDLHAEQTMKDKQSLAEQAVAEKWLLFFGHDRQTAAGVLALDDKGRFVLADSKEIPNYGEIEF